jgi:hypothetical protein
MSQSTWGVRRLIFTHSELLHWLTFRIRILPLLSPAKNVMEGNLGEFYSNSRHTRDETSRSNSGLLINMLSRMPMASHINRKGLINIFKTQPCTTQLHFSWLPVSARQPGHYQTCLMPRTLWKIIQKPCVLTWDRQAFVWFSREDLHIIQVW